MNVCAQDAHCTVDQSRVAELGRPVLQALSLGLGALLWLGVAAPAQADSEAMCSLTYDLPADIDLNYPFPHYAQGRFDKLSWNSFLALNAPFVGGRVSRGGDNRTQWSRWSSTTDLLECQQDPDSCDCPEDGCQSGDRYYPAECQDINGYQHYRVLAEESKVDDLFLESEQGGGLSNDPLIDRRGKFLRYEIVVSPATYDFVVGNEYYEASVLDDLDEPVNFTCGNGAYTGGNPANPEMGAIVIKNAWMELSKRKRSRYHTEKLLVYSPADRTSTGVASCKLQTMALVGQHIAHKTIKQPNWIWSTFEHRLNAPDCTALPPAGDMAGSGPSTACPTSVSSSYNFYPKSCSVGGKNEGVCQTCNAVPMSNLPADAPEGECTNPDVEDNTAWCLDLPPAETAGVTMACVQVPIEANYPTAHAQNEACASRLGRRSAWRNYQLVSTQWFVDDSDICQSGSTSLDRNLIEPQVDVSGDGEDTRPFLGNTSMETYVRSSCVSCHSKATVGTTDDPVGSDQMWWLNLEVADAPSETAEALTD